MPESVSSEQKPVLYFPTTTQDAARVLLVGLGVGVLVVLLSELIARYFIDPIFCRSTDAFTVCANGGMVAFNVSLVIVSMAAVAVLAKLGVFRPLLVAIGPAASLWGIKAYMSGMSWLEYGFWFVALCALTYSLFYWLMRVSNFVVSLIVLVVAIVVIRLTLIA